MDYKGGPRVDRVVDVPVLGSTGKVIDAPGHHVEDKILYVPDSELADLEAGDVANLGLSPFDTKGTAEHWLKDGYYSFGGGIKLAEEGKKERGNSRKSRGVRRRTGVLRNASL